MTSDSSCVYSSCNVFYKQVGGAQVGGASWKKEERVVMEDLRFLRVCLLLGPLLSVTGQETGFQVTEPGGSYVLTHPLAYQCLVSRGETNKG